MSETIVVAKHDPKMLDKILRMKPKQIEQYVAAQRRKHEGRAASDK